MMIKVVYRKARGWGGTSSEMKVLLLVIYIFTSVILGYISQYIPQFIKVVSGFLFVFVTGNRTDPTTIITTCCLPPLIG